MGGCVGNTDNSSIQMITIRLRRLKHELNATMQKIRGQAFAQQKTLIAQYKKPKSFRASAAQNAIANSITMKINKIHIYQIVRCHIDKIMNYKSHLSSQEKAKQSLYPSFGLIMFTDSILKDQSISQLCGIIKKKYPDIKQATEKEVNDQILIHHKKSQLPSNSMVNQYVLKLVNQENLDLAQINKVGHTIRYGA